MKMSSNNAVQTCVLPKWEDRRLGDIGEPLMCKRVLKDETAASGEIPFYKIGTFGGEPDAYISRSLYERLREKYPYPKKGDVLISAAGTVGRTVVFDGREAYFQDSNIVWIDNDESVVTNEYLSCLYPVLKWQTEDGGVVSRLYNENLRNQIISVPPLAEQRRIAEVLADADAVIGNMEKRIAKRKLIKQGMMQQLLTGAVRLPGFTGEWKEHRLTDVADFVTGTVSTDAIRKDEYVGTENMKPNCMGVDKNLADVPYASVREYRIGDVLLSNIRPYLKKCWLSTRNGGCSNDVIVVRGNSDMVMPEFLYSVLSQDAFFKYVMNAVVGTKMPRGDKKVIAQYGLRLPPKLAEQQAIAAVLTDMDSEITVLEKKVKKYRQLKSGMMSELLTGKVRLSEGK